MKTEDIKKERARIEQLQSDCSDMADRISKHVRTLEVFTGRRSAGGAAANFRMGVMSGYCCAAVVALKECRDAASECVEIFRRREEQTEAALVPLARLPYKESTDATHNSQEEGI